MNKIKIGIFGFGKTGQSVANEFIKDENFEVCWVVKRTNNSSEKYASTLLGHTKKAGEVFAVNEVNSEFYKAHMVDIIVDFSISSGVNHYKDAAQYGIKIISAISQYEKDDLDLLLSLKEKTAVLYSPNITLGINFLIVASQILQSIAPHADIEIVEEHYRNKNEVSGTALKIADILGLEKEKHVNSVRVGGIVGKHQIIFGLPNQTIRLTHESINRAAFGQGAIFAAKWLIDKSAGLYTMENIIIENFHKNIPTF